MKEMTFKELKPDNVFKVSDTEYAKTKRCVRRGIPYNAIRLEDYLCGFFRDSQVVEVGNEADRSS